ncbi:Protein of unknown function [Bacillus mycoides]|nr:Protein of unknown function [Bacillus mycoides]
MQEEEKGISIWLIFMKDY